MGTDKAVLEVEGVAMAVRAVEAMRDGGVGRVVCIGGDRGRLAELGLEVVADRHPGQGPLGGLCTALDTAQEGDDHVLVVAACDQYRMAAATIGALLRAARALDTDSTLAVVAATRGGGVGPPPLPLAVLAGPLAPLARAAFDSGERSLRSLLERIGMLPILGVDPRTLVDADHPHDLPSAPPNARSRPGPPDRSRSGR